MNPVTPFVGRSQKDRTTRCVYCKADQGLDRQAVLGWASDLIAQIHGRADRHGWELDEGA